MYRKIEKGQAGYTGKPLLLIGGAGIGKTTMAESIAEATGRPLVKFELGGRSDVREMAGFARSYVGAKQGSFTNALIGSGSLASLIYLDEIDKTGKSSEGSPQSLLMSIVEDKVLKDEFLGVKIDISQAMIIATANHFDKIDPILRNRFDIMFLGAYSFAEKMEIGRRHVIPKLVEAAGLDADEINITDKALALIIKGYTREPGIRGIEKKISKICENTVKHIMLGKSESLTVTPELLVTKEWLGTPPVAPDDVPKLDTVGWANGLYGSDEGGGVLPIKTAVMRSLNMNESAITHTGELQGKMKESLVNVSTILKNMLENVIGLEAEEKFAFVHKWRTGHDFHIEAVGNSKVDGPSAGVTMTTALASQMLDLYVVKNVAMTGKLDIHGKVKAIGGLEQKIPAAREVGLVTVIVPEENRKDVEALKPDITEGVDIIFVSDIEEVLKIALPGIEDKIDLTAFRNTLERTKRVGLDGSGKDAANQNVRGGFNKKTTIGFHSPRREPVRKPSGAKKLTP